MTPWAPAVRLRSLASDWRAWVAGEVALLIGGWAYHGVIWGGLLFAFSAPIILMGLLLYYCMAALATNWLQVIVLGVGLGALFVVLGAMEEGMGPDQASFMLLAPLIPLAIFRAIHVYVSPIWTVPDPD